MITQKRKKTEWLQIKVDPNFKRLVRRAARRKGIGISAWVRLLLDDAMKNL
jgi:antitoxin component of RelBE/YafQ-DinJ toxin-antitoxin module